MARPSAPFALALLVVIASAETALPQPTISLETPFSQALQALQREVDQYQILPDTHPIVLRVKDVFRRIVRVSGKRPGMTLEVFVLDTSRVLAYALPNGYVVITRGAAELAGSDDNALAFLLAHEVAHQVRDHLVLLTVQERLSLQSPSGAGSSQGPAARNVITAQAMELEADRLGILFATLAGYRAAAATPVLERVVAQVGSGPLHPDPRRRATAIREMVRTIAANVELFDLGLFYLVTGQYEGAARALESFVSLFPAREVYSNLGVAYHKRALLYRVDDGLVHSVAIDPQTRAAAIARLPRRLQGAGPRGAAHPVFRETMEKAVTFYRLAVDSDPEYALGHANLGAAYVAMGDYDFAIGQLKRALGLDSTLQGAYVNRGVAYLKNGDLQLAERDFFQARALDPGDPGPHTNLAVLYRQTGRLEAAKEAMEMATRLAVARRAAHSPEHTPREVLGPVAVGMAVDGLGRSLRATASRELKVPVGPRSEKSVLLYEPQGITVVLHHGFVEAAMAREGYRERTRRAIAIGSPEDRVRASYGPPSNVEGTSVGSFLVYPAHGLVFVVRGQQVTGWWIYEGNRDRKAP